jgi:hypothetical protein
MITKGFFIFFSLLLSLGSVNKFYFDELKIEPLNSETHNLLCDYYKEFKQPVDANKALQSNLNNSDKKNSLVNYYADHLN